MPEPLFVPTVFQLPRRFRVRVNLDGRIAIPKPIRDRLDIKPGDEFDVIEKAGTILLVPFKSNGRKNEQTSQAQP